VADKSKAGAERIARQQRIAGIFAMRLQGLSLEEIGQAQEPPISKVRVYKIITKALADTLTEPIEEMRRLEGKRLDELQGVFYERALNGDVFALDRVLSIMRQRARLFGLDLAQQVALNFGRNGEGGYEMVDGQPTLRVTVINDPESGRVNRVQPDADGVFRVTGRSEPPEDEGTRH
jgi:hypothetical protein